MSFELKDKQEILPEVTLEQTSVEAYSCCGFNNHQFHNKTVSYTKHYVRDLKKEARFSQR
ncbi:5543_t:CDS:2 [Funneliformis mosseae]|uniref:5543_t:CDS:1 n=1 Tax=Funneliformis mosseae TaxID=27381 RepID=A0A9N9F3C9_FUNMO|nr:5543_t:CDS:2 [Funneliformis mosseae]